MYTTRISRHIIDEEFHSFSLNVNVLLFLAKKRLNKNEISQELVNVIFCESVSDIQKRFSQYRDDTEKCIYTRS